MNTAALLLMQDGVKHTVHFNYIVLIKTLYYRLTLSTVHKINDEVNLVDVHGRVETLAGAKFMMILVFGWVSFLLSWMFNIMYYRVHPSAVDFNPSRARARLFIYIAGRRVKLPGYRVDNYRGDKITIRAPTTASTIDMGMAML